MSNDNLPHGSWLQLLCQCSLGSRLHSFSSCDSVAWALGFIAAAVVTVAWASGFIAAAVVTVWPGP